MKKILVILTLVPFMSFAHGDKAEMLRLSMGEAVTAFADAGHTHHFSSVKAWFSGAKVKVKFTLKDRSTMVYQCFMDHGQGQAEAVSCDLQ